MTGGPYELPAGWRWVRLGEVTPEMKSGFPFAKKGATCGEVLHLRPYNIGDDGELTLERQFLIPREILPPDWTPLKPGDVLFNNTNSVELVGKTALVRKELDAAHSNHLTRIRTRPDMCDGAWLALALGALWREGFFARNCNKWIGQAGYNNEALRLTEVPLPPLPEQRRIVVQVEALMERIQEGRRLRQQAKEETELLWQSILAEAFPKPGAELPAGWRWVRLGEVARVKYGKAKPKGASGTVPVIGSGGAYSTTERPLVAFPTVIIGRKGSAGEVTVVHTPSWPSDTAFYLEWVTETEPSFVGVWLTLNKPSVSGTTATLPSLSRQALESQLVPFASFDEQRRIVARLDEGREGIDELKASQEETETRLKTLEQSILEKAFRGQL